jgi:hypothetical protein
MLISVELSRALATYNVVVQASREGARQAVVTPSLASTSAACNGGSTSPAIVSACGLLGSVPSIDPSATNVAVTCAAPCTIDSQVAVTVTTTFTSLFADFFAFVGTVGAWWGVPPPALFSQAGFPMPHTTIMRYE